MSGKSAVISETNNLFLYFWFPRNARKNHKCTGLWYCSSPFFVIRPAVFTKWRTNKILKYIFPHLIRLRISLLILKIIFTVIGIIIIMNITINILLIIALVWLPVIFYNYSPNVNHSDAIGTRISIIVIMTIVSIAENCLY